MPKKNKESSSSDSDSGPEDRNPPPSKKAKVAATNEKPKSSSKDDADKNRWQLERNRFASINEFRGRKMVDIREYYDKNGEQLPTKKGICLSVTQWKKLLELANEITAAVEDQ